MKKSTNEQIKAAVGKTIDRIALRTEEYKETHFIAADETDSEGGSIGLANFTILHFTDGTEIILG